MNKMIMIGTVAVALLGVASAARADDNDAQLAESQFTFFTKGSVTGEAQQANTRNAQARMIAGAPSHAVKPYTAEEKAWFDSATPSPDAN